jgi:23S rRNA G2445 N2-methylase RlmL
LHRRGYRREGSVESGGSYDDDGDDDYEGDGGRRRRPPSSPGGGEGPVHKAAMKETLAAGLLLEAGWDKLIDAAKADGLRAVLVDPMTGSATLPTEAALIACDVAPGLVRIGSWRDDGVGVGGGGGAGRRDEGAKRKKGGGGGGGRGGGADDNPHRRPPCTRWKDFGKPGEWDDLLAEATRRARAGREWAAGGGSRGGANCNVRILCNEKNGRAAGLAEWSVRNADVGDIVSLRVGDCADWDLGGHGGQPPSSDDRGGGRRGVVEGRTIFVCNPPWGLRLTDDIDESWVSLREFLRREAVGCESWVLSGNKDLTKILRMKKVSVEMQLNAVYYYGT